MANGPAATTASRAALLELRQEREVVQQGHDFLDEKRILLARQLLKRLDEYRDARARLEEAETHARQTLAKAIASHGLEYLQLHPPPPLERLELVLGSDSYLGMSLPRAELRLAFADGDAGALAECARAYAGVAGQAAHLAAREAALLRLMADYRRTERRVRALENLILPELRQAERDMEDALEENEQEEAVRVRLFAGGRQLVS